MGNIERETIVIDGVELILSKPDTIKGLQWIGNDVYLNQILASWIIVDEEHDMPMNPQILGKPGVGKTTLAYCAGKKLGSDVYIYQCTVDTRPEDLIITPVIGENNTIKYHASSLVTAVLKGGICILDEANRMAEKSWASLAPLLDRRRYLESIIAGIKIKAHPNFKICVTMNQDSSTFEIPDYIHSRLQPQVHIDFPDIREEFEILKFNLPYAKDNLILYITKFLQLNHKKNMPYSIRDGINICRYYVKLEAFESRQSETKESTPSPEILNWNNLKAAVKYVLGKKSLSSLRKIQSKRRYSMGSQPDSDHDSDDDNDLSFLDPEHLDSDVIDPDDLGLDLDDYESDDYDHEDYDGADDDEEFYGEDEFESEGLFPSDIDPDEFDKRGFDAIDFNELNSRNQKPPDLFIKHFKKLEDKYKIKIDEEEETKQEKGFKSYNVKGDNNKNKNPEKKASFFDIEMNLEPIKKKSNIKKLEKSRNSKNHDYHNNKGNIKDKLYDSLENGGDNSNEEQEKNGKKDAIEFIEELDPYEDSLFMDDKDFDDIKNDMIDEWKMKLGNENLNSDDDSIPSEESDESKESKEDKKPSNDTANE